MRRSAVARAGFPLGGGTEVAEQVVGEFGGGGAALSHGREVARQGEVDGAVGERQQQRGQPFGVSGRKLAGPLGRGDRVVRDAGPVPHLAQGHGLGAALVEQLRRGGQQRAIAPGPTRSEMFDRWMSTEEARAAMAGHFPLNYIADPDDMARAALFLLSDESRWTTGTVFPCKGGVTAG